VNFLQPQCDIPNKRIKKVIIYYNFKIFLYLYKKFINFNHYYYEKKI
jgi:hypothetical protein